jgi:polysaccharide export outer membrane protein
MIPTISIDDYARFGTRKVMCVIIAASTLMGHSFSLAAQESSSSNANSFASQFTTTNRDVLIAPGDLLSITVFDTPEFSGTMRVSNEGNLTLPLVGSLRVAGLTAQNAAQFIGQKLVEGNFLKNPQVNVSFIDFINQNAMVLGDVAKPGPVPVLGSRTLWEIIGASGGVNQTAANKVSIVHRSDPTHPIELPIDWTKGPASQPNPQIFLGDTVQVPKAGLVYVVGEVNREGAYPIINEKMSVVQAISYSGGIKYNAKSSQVRLIRHASAERQVSIMNVGQMLKGDSSDVKLEDGDIIFVPNSAAKVIITRGITAAIAVSSSLAVYRFQ